MSRLRFWLAKRLVGAAAWGMAVHMRGVERMLPIVGAFLPVDRRERANWAFRQLKDALTGAQTTRVPGGAP